MPTIDDFMRPEWIPDVVLQVGKVIREWGEDRLMPNRQDPVFWTKWEIPPETKGVREDWAEWCDKSRQGKRKEGSHGLVSWLGG